MPSHDPRTLKVKISGDYDRLLFRVKKALIEGQKRIEAEKVRTYWETGHLIREHILKNKRAEYGAEVVLRLANDLNLEKTILNRCLKFVEVYPRLPIVAGRQQFSWSHYRTLITIPDEKQRLLLEKNILEKKWTSDELTVRIKKNSDSSQEKDEPSSKTFTQKLLTPLRGKLYTYCLVRRPQVALEKDLNLRIDLGFGVFHRADERLLLGFNEGDIIESRVKEDAYKFYKSTRTAKDLFTYVAAIEKVIDADTLKVRFDLGFRMEARETLRLRGIDAPEVSTKEGQEAKTFVQSILKESQLVVVRSSRSEKYGRYVADVFIPKGEEPDPETDVYLNNFLLEKGFAVRWEV